MRNYILNAVCIVDDGEVKAPCLVDTGLPKIFRFVVLLGREKRGIADYLAASAVASQTPN
jgi:hypothetical protein